MKFFVVEYPKPDCTVGYRVFDFEHEQEDAENFCKKQKEASIPVNIRVRDIDPKVFA